MHQDDSSGLSKKQNFSPESEILGSSAYLTRVYGAKVLARVDEIAIRTCPNCGQETTRIQLGDSIQYDCEVARRFYGRVPLAKLFYVHECKAGRR